MALTTEQLAARKIGGSDVATILGLNPYNTTLELYFEKRGEIQPKDLSENEHVEAGTELEDGIANLAARRMSRLWDRPVKLRRCNLTLSNPKYPWLTAHIDRDVVGEERGVEIKNVGARMAWLWGEQGTDEVPAAYLSQPQTYMIVKDYPVWTVAGYFGGADLRLFEIVRDREMDEIIIELTHDFWFNNVLAGVPPDANTVPPEQKLRVARRLYPGTSGEIVTADDLLASYRNVHRHASAEALRYKKQADEAKGELLLAMGEAAVLQFADGMQLVRKLVNRKGYTVADSSYMDARYKTPRAPKKGEVEENGEAEGAGDGN